MKLRNVAEVLLTANVHIAHKMGNANWAGLHLVAIIACIFMMAACSDAKVPASVRGYNHMENLSIHIFTVNETVGPNVRPNSGGGETCCVSLPKRWRPGLKAKVSWEYDQKENAGFPLPKNQAMEVDIPQYPFGGAVHIHFYDNHKIKMVVSPCDPDHPFYPLNAADLAPWTSFATKKEMREAAQRGGGSVDC